MGETRSTAGSWIVCEAATRHTVGGHVNCPRGGKVRVSRCLDCHLLETLEDERDTHLSCATPSMDARVLPVPAGLGQRANEAAAGAVAGGS